MQMAIPILVAIFTGVIFGIQVPTNGLLAKSTQSPIVSGFIIIDTGATLMGITMLVTRAKMQPNWAHDTPWYAYTGGIYEAIGVVLAAWVAPKLGAGTSLVILVITQVVVGCGLDHVGALGLEKHPVSLLRAGGCLVAIGGAFMVAKG